MTQNTALGTYVDVAAVRSEITAVEHRGKRQLAYPIDRHENGYYVVAQFSTEPGALPEFERLLTQVVAISTVLGEVAP